tara:strand:+ start:155 stop:1660 length:1506 start_codon:yes stop_codon:yes gene_type:complete
MKSLAPSPEYISERQLTIEGFETPFHRNLDPENRWVTLASQIPWDELSQIYLKHFPRKATGRPALSPRVVIGAVIIKHMCNLDDRETIDQISENMYMQYFLGYSSFTSANPFDPSLFVEIRRRLGDQIIVEMNQRILALANPTKPPDKQDDNSANKSGDLPNKGKVIMDATACPQDIAYPTDLNLLSEARQISERIIDKLYDTSVHQKKPRTYRKIARTAYLRVAQKKVKHGKVLRKAIRKQLGYLRRNLKSIGKLLDMLDDYPTIPLEKKDHRCLLVIQCLYDQQLEMFRTNSHSVSDRIVSIHQPHVRPIVRGKLGRKVEFGAKIHLSLVDGFSYLDTISWDAFSEGKAMMDYIEKFRLRFGHYPAEVLGDKAYCTRENRKNLKLLGIRLIAKPLGRPKAVTENHVRPGERNPIEGKFGQAKTAYGMNRIKARLKDTSQSWIASIILVLNLVKLAGQAPLWVLWSFSAKVRMKISPELVSLIRWIRISRGEYIFSRYSG